MSFHAFVVESTRQQGGVIANPARTRRTRSTKQCHLHLADHLLPVNIRRQAIKTERGIQRWYRHRESKQKPEMFINKIKPSCHISENHDQTRSQQAGGPPLPFWIKQTDGLCSLPKPAQQRDQKERKDRKTNKPGIR